MTKSNKKWIIAATLLVLFGTMILFLTACSVGWDFTRFGGGEYETNTYEIAEEFNDISIKTETADIVFLKSDDEKCKVVCCEDEKVKHSVSVVDGVLTIGVEDTRKWYEYILWFSNLKVTVYLPKTEYSSLVIEESTGNIELSTDFKFKNMDVSLSTGNVKCSASATETIKISASTGSVSVKNISVGTLDISVSTGKVSVLDVVCEGNVTIGVSTGETYLKNVTCKNLTSSGDTGEISLKNVIASEKFAIERSTGDVEFERCDAAEIFIKTDTGDVEGSLLTEKVFIVNTDTGEKDVPNTHTGGRCEITTDTGDIEIRISKDN